MNKPTKRHRDFTIIFKDPDLNGFTHPNDFINHCKSINYEVYSEILKYLIFQWEINCNDDNDPSFKTFYQMYFEFDNNISIKKIKENFFNGINVEISPRLISQEEAIKKCSDQTKSLFIKGFFNYGDPKKINKVHSPTNTENKEIPLNHQEQIVHIRDEVKNGSYKSLKDIEKDYPYKSYKDRIILQEIINRNVPINKLNAKQARVIWLYGKGGSGKTTWTNKYLRENGYNDSEITVISPPSLVYNDMVYFSLEDQNCKVLVVNEVDQSFPKHNNLIAWIDRVSLLPAKGSQIRNNFELIIVNSIYRPEEVFGFLGKRSAGQVLRRIFGSHVNSCVYKVIADDQKIAEAKKLNLSPESFSKWYQPIIELIPEPDYSLMKEEKTFNNSFFSKLKRKFYSFFR